MVIFDDMTTERQNSSVVTAPFIREWKKSIPVYLIFNLVMEL